MFELSISPVIPSYDEFSELVSQLCNSDWFEESKTIEEFKSFLCVSINQILDIVTIYERSQEIWWDTSKTSWWECSSKTYRPY